MDAQLHSEQSPPPNPWTSSDVESLLRERGWLTSDPSSGHLAWCERAAALLGPHASDRDSLASLLQLVFHYDAAELVTAVESHIAISRYAARDVLRETGRLLLESSPFDSDRFKEIVTLLKERLELTPREILIPIRLALAGRLGEGELDRVILLLDPAAALPWAVPVKSARARIVEFCSALD